jgi:hypothetical protein
VATGRDTYENSTTMGIAGISPTSPCSAPLVASSVVVAIVAGSMSGWFLAKFFGGGWRNDWVDLATTAYMPLSALVGTKTLPVTR